MPSKLTLTAESVLDSCKVLFILFLPLLVSSWLPQAEFSLTPLYEGVRKQRTKTDHDHGYDAQGCARPTSGGTLHVHVDTV